jgi:hypothetical protein
MDKARNLRANWSGFGPFTKAVSFFVGGLAVPSVTFPATKRGHKVAGGWRQVDRQIQRENSPRDMASASLGQALRTSLQNR